LTEISRADCSVLYALVHIPQHPNIYIGSFALHLFLNSSTSNKYTNELNMAIDAPAILGEPVTFPNGMKAPNRFLKVCSVWRKRSRSTYPFLDFLQSAMTERLCTYDDTDLNARGKPTPEYIKLYEEWGKGQIGVIVLVSSLPHHLFDQSSHLLVPTGQHPRSPRRSRGQEERNHRQDQRESCIFRQRSTRAQPLSSSHGTPSKHLSPSSQPPKPTACSASDNSPMAADKSARKSPSTPSPQVMFRLLPWVA
jgi:hypothetical protein